MFISSNEKEYFNLQKKTSIPIQYFSVQLVSIRSEKQQPEQDNLIEQ